MVTDGGDFLLISQSFKAVEGTLTQGLLVTFFLHGLWSWILMLK